MDWLDGWPDSLDGHLQLLASFSRRISNRIAVSGTALKDALFPARGLCYGRSYLVLQRNQDKRQRRTDGNLQISYGNGGKGPARWFYLSLLSGATYDVTIKAGRNNASFWPDSVTVSYADGFGKDQPCRGAVSLRFMPKGMGRQWVANNDKGVFWRSVLPDPTGCSWAAPVTWLPQLSTFSLPFSWGLCVRCHPVENMKRMHVGIESRICILCREHLGSSLFLLHSPFFPKTLSLGTLEGCPPLVRFPEELLSSVFVCCCFCATAPALASATQGTAGPGLYTTTTHVTTT